MSQLNNQVIQIKNINKATQLLGVSDETLQELSKTSSEKLKSQRNALLGEIDRRRQELAMLKFNIESIQRKNKERETELRHSIHGLAGRAYVRDINVIKGEIKELNSDIISNIGNIRQKSFYDVNEKKKEILRKKKLFIRQSELENKERLEAIDREQRVFTDTYQTITQQYCHIKSNFDKITAKCELFRNVNSGYRVMIRQRELENFDRKSHLMVFQKLVDSIRLAVGSETAISNCLELPELDENKLKEAELQRIKAKETRRLGRQARGKHSAIGDGEDIEGVMRGRAVERRVGNTIANLSNILEFEKQTMQKIYSRLDLVSQKNDVYKIYLEALERVKREYMSTRGGRQSDDAVSYLGLVHYPDKRERKLIIDCLLESEELGRSMSHALIPAQQIMRLSLFRLSHT